MHSLRVWLIKLCLYTLILMMAVFHNWKFESPVLMSLYEPAYHCLYPITNS